MTYETPRASRTLHADVAGSVTEDDGDDDMTV
jgi:hypothetical protein